VKTTAPERQAEGGEMARHIARVAARLFAERGYDATSVREIGEAAGVAKPTLYYHFGSKEGLAHALLTVPMNRHVAVRRAILKGPGEPIQKVERMIEADFEFCREDPDRARFIFALSFGPLNKGLSPESKCFGEAIHDLLAEAIGRAAEAGSVDPERVDSCFTALHGLTVIHTLRFLYRGEELGPDLAAQIVDDLLRGFSPPKGPTAADGKA
jgi:TetR/AcrR family transcriptional regulator